MKVLKALAIALVSGAMVFLLASCTGNASATPAAKPTIATVQKGNISVSVTGTGNLALEYTQELSFGQTGLVSQASNAKIAEVLVQPGDTVKQGQVLVKADTTDWQDQITQDQYALDNAQANLLTAQNNLATDQLKLKQQTAVQDIQTKIDNANAQLQAAQAMLQQAMVSSSPYAGSEVQYWQDFINNLTVTPVYYDNSGVKMQDGGTLGSLEKQMADLLANPEYYLATQVNGSAASVAAIKNLQMQIEQDQANITQKQNAVDQAQTNLDNDKTQPQEITAPYDGLITQVNVNQGDIVQRNANLIEIAHPDKFIANILVTEMDVMSLKIGEEATVNFDALSGLNFPAKITQIAPTATVQQGVVNYQVTVELTSTQPILPNRSGAASRRSEFTGGGVSATSGSPSRTPPSGTGGTRTFSGTFNGSAASSGATANQVQSINLKDGLSCTVNIVIQQKDNVLMIPSRAITHQGQRSTVQKVTGTTTQTVAVQTGITDGTNTEIVSGLNEGDQVSIPARATTTSTNQFRPPGGGFRIP